MSRIFSFLVFSGLNSWRLSGLIFFVSQRKIRQLLFLATNIRYLDREGEKRNGQAGKKNHLSVTPTMEMRVDGTEFNKKKRRISKVKVHGATFSRKQCKNLKAQLILSESRILGFPCLCVWLVSPFRPAGLLAAYRDGGVKTQSIRASRGDKESCHRQSNSKNYRLSPTHADFCNKVLDF